MATVTSVGSGNYDTGSTWDSGARPDSSDDVVIASGHTVTLVQAENANSLDLLSGGTLDGDGNLLTIVGENSSGFAVNLDGAISGTDTDIRIRTAATTLIDIVPTSGNVRHLTINHASFIGTFLGNTSISGNLLITMGELKSAGSNSLTVAGRTDIGPASGSADQATLTCNASAVSLGSGRTSSYALVVNQGGTFDGGSGNHTIGSIETKNNSNAKCTLTSGVTTIDSENTSDNFALSIEAASTFDDGNGTVTFTIGDSTRIRTNTKPLYNVIVNNANASIEYVGDQTIDNDLTVTAGKFRYNSFEDLTVTGDVSVTGILGHPNVATTSNSTFGSLTINSGGEYKAPSGTTTVDQGSTYVLRNLGTYTHNSGTLKVARSSASGTRFLELGSAAIHKLVIDNTATTAAVAFVGVVNCANDLEVTNGDFRAYGGSGDVTIDGDVTISNSSFFRTQTSQLAAGGVNASLGSLTINSGATYDATPLTTTITDETSGGYGLINSGTFTHNNGKLKIDFNTPNKDAHTIIQVNDLYDLEIDMNSSFYEVKFDDTSGNATNILNNLDITQGVFESKDNSDTLTIHGLTKITSNGTFMPDANHDTNKIIHNGLVTNEGTYKINDGTTVKLNGGIRNLGTITVA